MAEKDFSTCGQDVSVTSADLRRYGRCGPRVAVLHDEPAAAAAIKNLVEFIDTLEVLVASPADYQRVISSQDTIAVFLSQTLDDKLLAAAQRQIASLERSIPVVIFGGQPGRASATFDGGTVLHVADPLCIDQLLPVLEMIKKLDASLGKPEAGCSTARLIGESRDMQLVRALIERVAPSQATVLVTGESGTGKELIARQIHEQSGVKGEFIAINCGAIPDHLLESELFGHEKGAFTGAHAARPGRIELANGGTLFLDEIGDMPTAMQVKLLRVLQERVVERIGGTSSIAVHIRVVAATHRDLQACIEAGSFREDLYYRLSVFPIEISPLRDRPEDVEPLVRALIARVQQRYGVRVRLGGEALQVLSTHAWPGNVRELANLVERLAVCYPNREVPAAELPGAISNGATTTVDSIPADSGPVPAAELPVQGLDLKKHLAGLEKEMISFALAEAGGVVQRAADKLGIGRTTLVEKIRRHDLRS